MTTNIIETIADYSHMTKAKLFRELGLSSIFTYENAKTSKGEKEGYLTAIQYLAPHNLSGSTVCPSAEMAGCAEGCLNTAGRGVFNSTQKARLKKTRAFRDNTAMYMTAMSKDLELAVKKASREGLQLVVRLNGTSDIAYHSLKFIFNNEYKNIFDHFPMVQFYDYTKNISLVARYKKLDLLPINYSVTLSYSEANPIYADKALKIAKKYNLGLAVVFRNELPESFHGMRVINGDDTDLRFADRELFNIDDSAYVVGLSAKGKAKKDVSGFVVGA